MFQIITLIIMLILSGTTMWLYHYRDKKKNEDANDERWQAIQAKVNKTIATYFDFLIIPLVIAQVGIGIFVDEVIYVDLDRVFLISLLLFLSRNTIELVALKHYNKKI